VCGRYAYLVWLAISGIKRKAMGIPVDLSGQFLFAHAVRGISTGRLFENRLAQRSRGLTQALLTVASAARHQLSLHASKTDPVQPKKNGALRSAAADGSHFVIANALAPILRRPRFGRCLKVRYMLFTKCPLWEADLSNVPSARSSRNFRSPPRLCENSDVRLKLIKICSNQGT
jgi:hypothetical protein